MAVSYTIINAVLLQIVCVVVVLTYCFYLGAYNYYLGFFFFITEFSNFIRIWLDLCLFLSTLPGTQRIHSICSLSQLAIFFQLRKNCFLLLNSPNNSYYLHFRFFWIYPPSPLTLPSWVPFQFLAFSKLWSCYFIWTEFKKESGKDVFQLPSSQNHFKWD